MVCLYNCLLLPGKTMYLKVKAAIPTSDPRSVLSLGKSLLKAWRIIASWILYYDRCMVTSIYIERSEMRPKGFRHLPRPIAPRRSCSSLQSDEASVQAPARNTWLRSRLPVCRYASSRLLAFYKKFADTLRGRDRNNLRYCQATRINIFLSKLLVYIWRSHTW